MMKKATRKSPVVNGLRDISMGEYWKDPLLPAEALREKLNGSPVDAKQYPQLAKEIKIVQELLLAIGTRRYAAISLRATVDLFQAVDYFLVMDDFTPDSREGGYTDDAEVVHRVFVKHESEIRAFEEWLRVQ
jgi:hypothetical protein